jgi:hypothetical protein
VYALDQPSCEGFRERDAGMIRAALSSPSLAAPRRLLLDAFGRFAFEPIGEIAVSRVLRVPSNRVGAVVVESFNYEIKIVVGNLKFHKSRSANPSPRLCASSPTPLLPDALRPNA